MSNIYDQMALLGRKRVPEYKSQHKQQQHMQKKSNSAMRLALKVIVLIIIIAGALYFLFFLNVNETAINSPTVVNVTQAGSLYHINNNQYYISLASISVNTGTAYIHITKLPIFVNPLLNVTLTLTNVTQINAGSNFSNIAIQLQSLSPHSIAVKITPLFESLQIRPTYQYIKVLQSGLNNNQQGQQSTTTIASTTTIRGGSSTSTTAGTTTTTIAANNTRAAISTALKADSYYALMLNFSLLYKNTSQCTPLMYNTSYVRKYGHLPNGQNSYVNVSQFTPYNMSSATTNVGHGNYNVSFVALTSALGTIPAMTIEVNVSAKRTVSDTFAPSGLFGGMSYSQIKSNYATALSGGACGIEVP